MKYVITEKQTGTQHIFTSFLDVMEHVQKWYGDDETSLESQFNAFIKHHLTEII
tara:strand:- start:628 stop:789 length:162 start_codon:yes stop_codon:yes gene_type:complete